MDTTSVRLEFRTDGVALLTIDQPGAKVNVLTGQLWTDLETAIDSLMPRVDVKGLVIASGKPGVFIAGADLKLLANAPAPNDPAVRAFIELGLRVLEKLEALPFPTCAAIDGAALGGGLEVALACDIRIVSDNPKVQLGLPEVKLGLIPGWGGTQRLPRIVGLECARRMLSTGEPLLTEEAVQCGLVELAPDRLLPVAVELLLRRDVAGVRFAKQQPMEQGERANMLPLKEGIALETEAFMRLAGSPESKRLIGEFFASRKK